MGAMSKLGGLLETGMDGVEKDIGRAVDLYSRAISEGNDTRAMFRLGSLLSRGGEGVEVDIGCALDLLNASNGWWRFGSKKKAFRFASHE